ncbi:MAG TPA: triphosphoribosyl-dephospho-CoA synthase [Methylomirabilota bacterium]
MARPTDCTLVARPSPARLAAAATLACTLEACAEKVGNVTPTRGFADARFDDFALSAQALGAAVAAAPGRVGRTVYRVVAATARVAPSNTNLGMALLFAPLAAAARAPERTGLRRRLDRVLRELDVDDARWAYRAIRLARPGGLGSSGTADVRRPPAVTLRQAMRLAAGRDTIASEYVRGFAVTFDVALAGLRGALGRKLGLLDAIAETHLELMARVPDTLIARKAGAAAAAAVARRARAVVRAGGLGTIRGRAAARRLDQDLRQDGNRLNPGTSADLVAAALFVWLLETPVRRQLAAEPADPRDCGPDPGGPSGAGYGAPKGAKPLTQAWRAR